MVREGGVNLIPVAQDRVKQLNFVNAGLDFVKGGEFLEQRSFSSRATFRGVSHNIYTVIT
jgi:hypothetical protein